MYRHKATVYFSKHQIDNFIKNCTDLDEYFTQSHGNELALIFEDALRINTNSYVFEVCFANENTSLNHVDNYTISSILPNSKIAVISLFENYDAKTLLYVRSNSIFEKIEFNKLESLNSVYNWIICNVERRNFNLSPKHGENGVGNWEGASSLLCSRIEAQELLNKAIPDFSIKVKELFYFDESHNTYIEFYFEGDNPQRQWHGFHLDIIEWNKRIPSSIREYFGH